MKLDYLARPHPAQTVLAWGRLGHALFYSTVVPSWKSTEPLIAANTTLQQLLRDDFNTLLQKSDARLAPLVDPLNLDLSTNRWFASRREENYSDWLAWIIQCMPTPELVLGLLKINELDVRRLRERNGPSIKREMSVEEGYEGQTGRIDIFIHYPAEAAIDVEVKVVDAESAKDDLRKNAGYARSLARQYKERAFHVLLVTDAEEDSYDINGYEYRVLKWSAISVELRKIVLGDVHIPDLLTKSLILAFVGAIEQNLLNFPHKQAPRFMFNERVIRYLEDNLGREPHL